MSIPVNNSTSLFFSLVPHARQEDEGGLRDGLKQAEESSKGNQTSEIFHCGVKSKRDSPQDDVQAKPFGNRNALDDQIFGPFDKQNNNVDNGCQP